MGLGYIVKQIYDKHKVIWWAKINAGEVMTRDDFIKQQDIVYLDRKYFVKTIVEKATLILHTNVTHIDDLNKIGHAWMVQSQ